MPSALLGIFMLQNNENYTFWVGDERLMETPPFVADLRWSGLHRHICDN